MLVTYSLNDTRLVFSFECEEGEPKRASPKFASSTFFVDLQGMTSLENIHPDHLALSAVLVTRPGLRHHSFFNSYQSEVCRRPCGKQNSGITSQS